MPRAGSYVECEVVCRINEGADIEKIAAEVGAVVIDGYAEGNTYLLAFGKITTIDSLVASLEMNEDVAFAQPNYIVELLDPFQTSQPFIDQTSQAFVDGEQPFDFYGQYEETSLYLDSTHLITTGEDIVVAVIDGGLDNINPLFAGHLDPAGFDFVDVDYEPWTDGGIIAHHGTFVAGTVLRAAPGTTLMILRAFDQNGIGTSFRIAHSINHAVTHGADIINMSFGTGAFDLLMAEEITYACSHDVIMVAAAGNDNAQTDQFPGSHFCVMNVAAVDSLDIKADFSNYGMSISVSAPGVEIYGPLCGSDTWGWWSGTSFAAPFVAGLAALVKTAHPDAAPYEIETIIQDGAVDINDLNTSYAMLLGAGRINFLQSTYLPGDANFSQAVNLGDVVYLVSYVFKSGPAPVPLDAGDNNCDYRINVGDAVHLINYIFRHGEPPGCPW